MKKFLKVFLIVLLLACSICDVWFAVVYFTAPEKIVQSTYNVSPMTTSNETDTRTFVELNYYTNKNKNGYEMFELKFNYFMDEEKNSFYSQGLQYVVNSETGEIEFEYKVNADYGHYDKLYDNRVLMLYHDRDLFGSYYTKDGTGQYQYMSDDNFETTMMTTNPIDQDTYFTIQIDDDLYKMQFKGVSDVNFAEDEDKYENPLGHVGTEMMAYSEYAPCSSSYL